MFMPDAVRTGHTYSKTLQSKAKIYYLPQLRQQIV